MKDNKKIYGLTGHPLTHSFSKDFFNTKFQKEKINAEYRNFDIDDISHLPGLLQTNKTICGLNVTIPYKQQVMHILDETDPTAAKIGAVNVIKIIRDKDGIVKTKGYNSDIFGFRESLRPLLSDHQRNALVLGTGGASKAVAFVLEELGIGFEYLSRTKGTGRITYQDLTEDIIKSHTLIVNTTPLGMYPDITGYPAIPYQYITKRHLCFDLIYNPEETLFLKYSKEHGASIKNGMEMLELQALEAWRIWNT